MEPGQALSRCPDKGQAPKQREGARREARSQRGRWCIRECVHVYVLTCVHETETERRKRESDRNGETQRHRMRKTKREN